LCSGAGRSLGHEGHRAPPKAPAFAGAQAGKNDAVVHFTAPKAGTYPVKCTHTLHAGFGMTGKIIVD